MTQPGASIISDKMNDFKKVLGDKNVILVQKTNEMIKLYKSKPSKPVVALFSPHNALLLLTEAEKEGIDIISKTRFCLDEIHERSVDTIIPIGQLIYAFIQDANIATPAKSYVTALALQTLKKSPYITCCPDHPTILYRKPQRGVPLKCIISGCRYWLCSDC